MKNDVKNTFVLPQAYLIRQTGKIKERIYLGDLSCVQYLEDSNLIDAIIQSAELPKFRVFKGTPIFRF